MTNELTDLTNIPAPTLTLDPVDDGEVAEASIIEVDSPAAPSLADSLSAEELAQVDAFAQQIDIANSQQVLTFGAGAQKKMASFSETALAKVRTQDLGEAGDLIAGVVTELKNFDVDDDDKGFFGLFKKSANKITSLKARYDTAEANVDKIAKTLEGHQVQLMKDAATLDKLYELNLTYFKELTMYLLAGRQRLTEVREGELAELSAKAQASGSTEDAEAVQKLSAACNRFEKKLSDLDLSRTVAMQMAPQIRLVQNNEMLMIEKIQTISTTSTKKPDNLTAACAMRMSVDQKYIYCTNAGENTISVYKRDEETGLLSMICCLPISGSYPKDVAVFPDGKHIASVNHDSGTISFFKIDYEKKLLIMSSNAIKCNEPNSCIIVKVDD